MKKFKSSIRIATGLLSAILINFAAPIALANSFNGGLQTGLQQVKSPEMPSTLFGYSGIFTQLINIMLFFVGVLSVIMLIIGGLRYVVSGGDSKKVESAKNTILYAIIGLVVAILSYAIVNFVVSTLISGGNSWSAPAGGGSPTNV